ncbi:MAG: 16S rRNA (cytidine(1402)-2'-O)-methyltransferase [Chloroflexi bacterium]|nr:16S rRNA (cytidine(1402)-2'-O)-methyltransferase [Chloroflexota bacterium]
MGRLYILATPIGNLEDLSPRAARILGEVSLVVAEDTREARKLLTHIGARARVASFHAHSGPAALAAVLSALAEGDVAYVSDAGTPAVSDPGPALVRGAADAGHEVLAVPGPSAVTAAISVSGLTADSFVFLGFLPRKGPERRQILENAATSTSTIVLFEAPHRLQESLQDLHAVLGDRRIAVCRELTKMFEETFRGTVSGAVAHFTAPRGEFVIVVEGAQPVANGESDAVISAALERLREQGLQGRSLVEAACVETGAPRSRVYRLALASRRPPAGHGPASERDA